MGAVTWACPKCGARANEHGKKACVEGGFLFCGGFLCECGEEDPPEEHGESFTDPCPKAKCHHCGWCGSFPKMPKGLQPWEKRALLNGWVMPEARKKELGL